MTEHSIEELERQWQSAKDRLREAARAEIDAGKRVYAARLEATGLAGHVVEMTRTTYRTTSVLRILVTRLSSWGSHRVGGPVIRKDGTPGERQAEVDIASAKDLGPYVAKASA